MADVSVVIPARNAEATLASALESVASQTLRPLEVIVVDDASADATADVARRAGATVLSHESGRPAAVRNAGVAAARGELLAFLDADDRWWPAKLERQVAALAARPELGFVGCLTRMLLADPGQRPAWWQARWDDGAAEPSLLPSAVLVRRGAFAVAGPYRDAEDLRRSDDVEWTARAQDAGVLRAVVPEVLVDRIVHPGSVSIDHDAAARRHLAILRESVQRKRARR